MNTRTTRAKTGQNSPSTQLILVVLVICLGPLAVAMSVLFALPAFAFLVRENVTILSLLGGGGLLLLLGIFLPTFVTYYRQLRGHSITTSSARNQGLRGRSRAFVIAMSLSTVAIFQGIASNIVAAIVDYRLEARLPDVRAFYRNHDLALVVGQSLRMLILRRSEREPKDDPGRAALVKLANHAPGAWIAMIEDPSAEVLQ